MLWDESLVSDAVRDLRSAGLAWGDVFQERLGLVSLAIAGSRVHESFRGLEQGVAVRASGPAGLGSASTNLGSPKALTDAVDAAVGSRPGRPLHLESRTAAPPTFDFDVAPDFEPGRVLSEIDAAARSESPDVVEVSARVATRAQEVRIDDTDGRSAADRRAQTTVIVQVIARRDGRVAWDYDAFGCSGTSWGIEVTPADVGAVVARGAVAKLDAVAAPAGRLPVVLAPGAGGIFAHEACGHGVEGDAIAGATTAYSALLGRRIAGEQVTVVDDPTVPRAVASYAIDDDGTPARRTVLVDRGELVGFLTDRVTAGELGRASSGNSRREFFEHLPLPRMTNLSVERGTDDPAEIVRSVRRGIYATKLAGGQVNATTGAFVFSILSGFEIEGGEIARPVQGVTLAGTPADLATIEAVGSDHGRTASTCVKKGQTLIVSSGSPTLLLPDVVVGGGG